MHLKSLHTPYAASPAFLTVREYGEYAPTTGALMPSWPAWARIDPAPGGWPVATSSDTPCIERRYGVKFVVGSGATWMLNLMVGVFFATCSSDDLNDWPHA